jgi:outer membrane protein OmpA-like peptidoglycan-associated protein
LEELKLQGMKKTFILATIFIFAANNMFGGIHEKYESGYTMLPSVVNTDNDETGMSFYNDKIVYSVKDNSGAVKIYSAVIDNDNIELGGLQEETEMAKLNFEGTFGFDEQKSKMYFSKYEKSTKTNMLYEAVLEDGKWKKAKKLKIEGLHGYRKQGSALVNAGWLYRAPGFSGFFNPTLANGGSRIYFSSDFSGGQGERDIWYIDIKDKKGWSAPQNLGSDVNTKGREDYPFVVGDSVLYFATTTDSYGGMDLAYSIFEGEKWINTESLSSVYNSAENDYNLVGNKDVLFFISGKNKDKKDDIYRPNRADVGQLALMAEPKQELEPQILMKTFPWKLFYFDFDVDILSEEFYNELDELFVAMQDYIQDHDFVIKGHTDERGSNAYNDKLSRQRATTIFNLLTQKGIPRDKMKIEAHGENQLVIKNAQTEEEHAQNRRVEVDIVKMTEE